MIRRRSTSGHPARRRRGGEDGAAAVEFALWTTMLIVPILSAADFSLYVFQKMQLESAGQYAAQNAWHNCDIAKLPAVTACPSLVSNMTTAAQQTSLGSNVTIPSGGVTEGYYCVNASNALVLVGTAGAPGTAPVAPSPNDCHTVIASSTTKPGDYLQVSVSYAYTPAFNGLSLAALLTTPITKTAWMRLN